ncbi:hypothetical protein TGVEG_441060 [Toxoplasma gondii VEG]|uniref:Uncharacterized protein n=1 Tax=Toxoplasma gondii (strain ATCC 50861 / VEG) TaxID=432359 RepID=V5B5C2_TOXGV|nr:hypothetical protein TGVEG_441060 [Toxoplasma gondii VEG]
MCAWTPDSDAGERSGEQKRHRWQRRGRREKSLFLPSWVSMRKGSVDQTEKRASASVRWSGETASEKQSLSKGTETRQGICGHPFEKLRPRQLVEEYIHLRSTARGGKPSSPLNAQHFLSFPPFGAVVWSDDEVFFYVSVGAEAEPPEAVGRRR